MYTHAEVGNEGCLGELDIEEDFFVCISTIGGSTGDDVVGKSGSHFAINFHSVYFYPIDNLYIEDERTEPAVTHVCYDFIERNYCRRFYHSKVKQEDLIIRRWTQQCFLGCLQN